MLYRITPLEPNSIIKRDTFLKPNMEFRCGMIWKIGSLLTKIKPSFLQIYNPNAGIAIKDIPGAEVSETYKGKKSFNSRPQFQKKNKMS